MNMDWVPWVIRALIIIVGIVTAIMVWRGKREGRYQEYSFRFLAIGIPIFTMGVILLIVSFITGLSFYDYGLFLTAAGAICIIIGLVIRGIWEKNH